MKFTFVILFLCSCLLSPGQDGEHIIDSKFPFKMGYPESVPPFAPGAYLFKTDIEYFDYQSAGIFNPILIPAFFEYNEMGLVILRSPSENAFYRVESVIETHSRIIVNLVVITGRYWKPDMLGNLIFLKLRKSGKEVFISEAYDEGDEIPENHESKCVPY